MPASREDRWLLPEGIDELLPGEAAQLERLRRRLLDLFGCWGYELVIPPLVEYLESLLTGTGNDLDLQTFKLTDQLSGRMMGVRADMTPQVARIDAHGLGTRDEPVRLCYSGIVLHTRGDGFAGSRCPMQLGAELYGHAGIESDAEVLDLMLEMLHSAGVANIYLDVGHVGLFRNLARQAGIDAAQEAALFDAMQRKAAPEIQAMIDAYAAPAEIKQMLAQLIWLNGDSDVLDKAAAVLAKGSSAMQQALTDLRGLASHLQTEHPDIQLHFDLAELRGYHYHTGIVFAAYLPGAGQAIAQGGRYDDIGKVFGRARPATGFSTDLKSLLKLSRQPAHGVTGIYAPGVKDVELRRLVRELRARGERVVQALPGQIGVAEHMQCDRELKLINQAWTVVPTGKQHG